MSLLSEVHAAHSLRQATHPDLSAFVKRVAPDPKIQDTFDEYMPQVVDEVLELWKTLREKGAVMHLEEK